MGNKTPAEAVDRVEKKVGRSFGPNIKKVLVALIEVLDERYE